MQNAWNFFELVESTDAATRVLWSNRGGWVPPATSAFAQPPSLWYPIQDQGSLTLYKQGKSLHAQVCPSVDWTAQRNLGIPTTPLTNVYPAQCPS
jgi:ABC-type glycerol-3-phosphate transport system substrate-binding protein